MKQRYSRSRLTVAKTEIRGTRFSS